MSRIYIDLAATSFGRCAICTSAQIHTEPGETLGRVPPSPSASASASLSRVSLLLPRVNHSASQAALLSSSLASLRASATRASLEPVSRPFLPLSSLRTGVGGAALSSSLVLQQSLLLSQAPFSTSRVQPPANESADASRDAAPSRPPLASAARQASAFEACDRGDWGSESGRGAKENLRLWRGAHALTCQLRQALLQRRASGRRARPVDVSGCLVAEHERSLQAPPTLREGAMSPPDAAEPGRGQQLSTVLNPRDPCPRGGLPAPAEGSPLGAPGRQTPLLEERRRRRLEADAAVALLGRLAEQMHVMPSRDIVFVLSHAHELVAETGQRWPLPCHPSLLAVYAATVQALLPRLSASSSLEWKDILVPIVDLLLAHPDLRSPVLSHPPYTRSLSSPPHACPSAASLEAPTPPPAAGSQMCRRKQGRLESPSSETAGGPHSQPSLAPSPGASPSLAVFDFLLRDLCVRVARCAPSLPPHLLLFFFNAFVRIGVFYPPLIVATAKSVEQRLESLSAQDVSMAVTTFALVQRQRRDTQRVKLQASAETGDAFTNSRPHGKRREHGVDAHAADASAGTPPHSSPASLPSPSSFGAATSRHDNTSTLPLAVPSRRSPHAPSDTSAASPGLPPACLPHSPVGSRASAHFHPYPSAPGRGGEDSGGLAGRLPDVSGTFESLLRHLATTPAVRQQLPLSSAVQILSACARCSPAAERRRANGDASEAHTAARSRTNACEPATPGTRVSSAPTTGAASDESGTQGTPYRSGSTVSDAAASPLPSPGALRAASGCLATLGLRSPSSAAGDADVRAAVFSSLFADVLALAAFESWTPQLVASAMNACTACKNLAAFRRREVLALLFHRLLFTVRVRQREEGLTAQPADARLRSAQPRTAHAPGYDFSRGLECRKDARCSQGAWRRLDDAFSDEKVVISFSLALHALGKENVRLQPAVLTEVLHTMAWLLKRCGGAPVEAGAPVREGENGGEDRRTSGGPAPEHGTGVVGGERRSVNDREISTAIKPHASAGLSREWAVMAWGLAKLVSYADSTPGKSRRGTWSRAPSRAVSGGAAWSRKEAGRGSVDSWKEGAVWLTSCEEVFRPLYLLVPSLLLRQAKPDLIAVSQLADAIRRSLLFDVGAIERSASATAATGTPPVLPVPFVSGEEVAHCLMSNTPSTETDLLRRGSATPAFGGGNFAPPPVPAARGDERAESEERYSEEARRCNEVRQSNGHPMSTERPSFRDLTSDTATRRERGNTTAPAGGESCVSDRGSDSETLETVEWAKEEPVEPFSYLTAQRLMTPDELTLLLRFIAGYLMRHAETCKPHQLLQTSWLYIQLDLLPSLQCEAIPKSSPLPRGGAAASGSAEGSSSPNATSDVRPTPTSMPIQSLSLSGEREMATLAGGKSLTITPVTFMGCVLDRLREDESSLDEGNSFFLQQMLRAYVLKYPAVMKRHPKRVRKFVKRRLDEAADKDAESASDAAQVL
ncbi:hypothetical protein BESB_021570 [Besnoitia besnoiti]|uniref:Uncharacterized protein n=1 Tax=Besnoitia besnoiti TaxID=94643 RepID=A0A2A9M8H6_BESBE|nr:hypothetical protein BESB_021570 [Besnoitia besnoiti]PFH32216.1 hypothetical protein BESB_021570 [Besnoitia besnoiti]